MQMTLRNTAEIVRLDDGHEARVWEGTTARGTQVAVLVMAVALIDGASCEAFELEMDETAPPAAAALWSSWARLVLP